ncbi:MAG: transglutaminase-like domain-containing protein, partial [Thermoproteota archaeon]
LMLAGSYPQVRRTASYVFVHEVTIENRGPEPYLLEGLRLEALLNTTTQTSYVLEFPPEGRILYDEQGNAYISIPETALQPGGSITARSTVKVLTETSWGMGDVSAEAGCFSSIPEELVDQYCKQEGPYQTEDPRLIDLAEKIRHGSDCTSGNVLNVVEKMINWIDGNIKYETHVPPLYPNQTLLSGSGDCDEKANLLITLCRIMRIPAYLQTGFVVQSDEAATYLDGHYRSEGLVGHAWAMVYIPPWGWLPVDLTYYEGAQDPLSHITASAWARDLVIQSSNVVSAD